MYGWEYSVQMDTLHIYKLRPSADPDSVYQVLGKAYTLLAKGPLR